MTFKTHFIGLALMALLACSCTGVRTPRDLRASVSSIRQFADSFVGLTEEEARSKLAGAKMSDEEWKGGGFGGKQLVATFPEYEVRVLFLKDKVVTTSVQVISK